VCFSVSAEFGGSAWAKLGWLLSWPSPTVRLAGWLGGWLGGWLSSLGKASCGDWPAGRLAGNPKCARAFQLM